MLRNVYVIGCAVVSSHVLHTHQSQDFLSSMPGHDWRDTGHKGVELDGSGGFILLGSVLSQTRLNDGWVWLRTLLR